MSRSRLRRDSGRWRSGRSSWIATWPIIRCADLNALFVSHGILPLTINSIEFIAWRSRPPDEYAEIQARCRELSRIAQAIGCPTVVVVPSPTPDRNLPWADVVAEYVRVLRDLGEIAGEFGIRLSFEFLGFGWCSVRTPRAGCEIVRVTGRANVGMTVDAAHFYGGGGLLDELDVLDPRVSSPSTWTIWRTRRRRRSPTARVSCPAWASCRSTPSAAG